MCQSINPQPTRVSSKPPPDKGDGICRDDIPLAFFPSGAAPLPTDPLSLRSMNQSLVSFWAFLSVKAKMAPPFLMASLRSASSERAEEMRSKADEDGKASKRWFLLEGKSSSHGLM